MAATDTTTATTAPAHAPAAAGRSGARSGALIAGASAVATLANYLFLLVAGRVLGSEDYGGLAALLGVLTAVFLPTGALQLAVSREVSRRIAAGDGTGAAAFAWAVMRLGLIATVPVLALGFALVVPLAGLLQIDSTTAVAIAAAGLSAAFVFPVALGVLQGYQRFTSVATLYVLPFALRLALLVGVAWAGFRLGGAVYAAIAGGIVGAAVAVTLIEQPLRRGARAVRPALGPFLAYLGPVVLGLVGIAILTNADLIVVKARFPGDDAGAYAAASAFARVAFFLPVTILAVLFPRTAARQARGEETEDILGRSLLVTAGFCGVLTLAYGLTGRGIVHTTFGADFAEGGELLAPFAVAMALYALANILVGFHLSRGETRYAWILAAAVPLQIALLAIGPGSLRGVVWANVGVAATLLVAHEALVGSSVPALRAGARALLRGVTLPRAAAREAGLALVAAALLACALTWPLARGLGSSFMGTIGADASAGIWWFWHLQQEGGYHLFGTTHHVLGGAPFGYAESNALNLQWLLPYYPAYLATAFVGEVAAYNLVVLSGFALSGAAMYLLARYLGCGRLAAAWAGLVYVVFPAHLARVEHASLLHFEVLVLALLTAAAAAVRPSVTRFGLVALAAAAAWLTSGYFGVMAVVGAAAFALGAAAVARAERARLVGGTAAATLLATALVGGLSTISGVEVSEIRERNTLDLQVYGLRAHELVVPPPGNSVVGPRLQGFYERHAHGANPSETANYLGLLTIALAVAALVLAWRRRRRLDARTRAAVVGLSAVAAASLLLSTPSPVFLFGQTWTWTPSRVLWELVPAFRVPSRWTALTMAAVVPLAALGLEQVRAAVAHRWSDRDGRLAASVAVVGTAMLVSVAELHVPLRNKVEPTGPAPALYDAVDRAPAGRLAEYPLKRSDIYNFWQREHGRQLVNGAPVHTLANDVERTLVDPDAPGTAARLALLGVTTIVTRPDSMDFFSADPVDVPDANWGAGYDLLERFPDGSSVWRVSAAPAPAVTALPSDSFVDGVVHEDGFVGHPLTGQTGHLELVSGREQVVRLSFDAQPVGATRMVELAGAEGRVVVDLDGRTRVSALVRIPRGRSRVELRIEPAQQPGELPLEVSAPWTEPASGAPAVEATPIAPVPVP